ncbi:hypothetical protein IC229_26250 [Spirosoma sp. BT702]|uniref:Uncharacterized protein n=1 Tax=Spirosoma profusum TaxID=2771354 RepID=A0A927ASP1_9BACT|nr:hypothetical protein [Spirosoma profusum]MBD2704173.1 hypothetical protein [Spirosoma profusum]
MAGAVNIVLGVIITDFVNGFKQAGQTSSQFSKQIKNDFNGLSTIGKSLGSLFAVDQVIGFGQELLSTSGKFEKYNSILKNALGSQSAARSSLGQLTDFAAETPNQLDELTGSFIKFVNRGLIPSKQQLTNFGDLAASQGKGFDQLTEAILDAQSGEFERLKEFGVRASKSGDQVSLSFKGLTQTVGLTSEGITGAIQKFGQLSGVAGSMSAVAQTQEGLVSNLGDAYDRLLVALGDAGISGTFKQVVSAASSLLGVFTDLVANSPAQELRKQQVELNSLVGAIALANDNETVRLSLIQKLNQDYPEFLGKIDAESVSTELLSRRLADVNAQYERKIRIALGEEKIKKANEELTDSIRQQSTALQILARESGKTEIELERMSQADRVALAKKIAARQPQFIQTPGGLAPVSNRLTALPNDLVEGLAKQKKAEAELARLTQENAERQSDLTTATVNGYKEQIAQVREQIKLGRIKKAQGEEEIKRLNDQIRIAQGKPLAPVKPPVITKPEKESYTKPLTELEELERKLKNLQEFKQDNARFGITIAPETLREMEALENQIKRIKGEFVGIKLLDNIKPLADAVQGFTFTTNVPTLPGADALKDKLDDFYGDLRQYPSFLGDLRDQLGNAGGDLFSKASEGVRKSVDGMADTFKSAKAALTDGLLNAGAEFGGVFVSFTSSIEEG